MYMVKYEETENVDDNTWALFFNFSPDTNGFNHIYMSVFASGIIFTGCNDPLAQIFLKIICPFLT